MHAGALKRPEGVLVLLELEFEEAVSLWMQVLGYSSWVQPALLSYLSNV